MSASALSCVDPQVRVTVSDSPEALGARSNAPLPANPIGSAIRTTTDLVGARCYAPADEPQPAPPPIAAHMPSRAGSPNGLTHALTSQQAVIDGESAAGLDAYRAEMLAALQPHDRPEHDQVEVIVMSQWRLRRLWRQETGIYGHWKRDLKAEDPHGTYGFLNDCVDGQALTRLYRVEAHFTRTYLRAESRLRLLQDLRRKGLRAEHENPAAAEPEVSTGGVPDARRARSNAPLPIPVNVPVSLVPEEGVGARCCAPSPSEPHPPPSPIPATHSNDAAIGENTNRPALAESVDPVAASVGASAVGLPEAPAAPCCAPTHEPRSPPIPLAANPTHRDDSAIGEIPNCLPHAAD